MKHILVVDDDSLVCSGIRGWLEQKGFSVFVADGGETGLSALESSSFDLMIVDIFMPHMRGFESVRVFHQRAPTVPLIAISGYIFAESITNSGHNLTLTITPASGPVAPEPSTWTMMGLGLAAAFIAVKKRRGARVSS